MTDDHQSADHEPTPLRPPSGRAGASEPTHERTRTTGLADLHMTEHDARRRTTLAVEGLARAAARLAIVAASIDAKLTVAAEAAEHDTAESGEEHYRG